MTCYLRHMPVIGQEGQDKSLNSTIELTIIEEFLELNNSKI